MRLDVTVGADKSGCIKALDLRVLSNTGAYGEHGPTVLLGRCFKNLTNVCKS